MSTQAYSKCVSNSAAPARAAASTGAKNLFALLAHASKRQHCHRQQHQPCHASLRNPIALPPHHLGDSSEKRICIPNLYPDLGLLLSMTERRSGQSHHLTQDQVQGGTSLMLRIIMLRIIMQSSAADNDVVQ